MGNVGQVELGELELHGFKQRNNGLAKN